MRSTVWRSVEWRVGVVVGFALASAAWVAAGCQSAENAFAAILATVFVQLLKSRIAEDDQRHVDMLSEAPFGLHGPGT
jgi:hypothetical protein